MESTERRLPPDSCIVVVTGMYPVTSDVSVSLEVRDYVLALKKLGVPTRLVELMCESTMPQTITPLVLATGTADSRWSALGERLAHVVLPFGQLPAPYMARFLQSKFAARHLSNLQASLTAAWAHCINVPSTPIDPVLLPDDKQALAELGAQRGGAFRRVVCMVDGYDLHRVPATLWQSLALRQIRRRAIRGQVYWVVRVVTETTRPHPAVERAIHEFDQVWVPSHFHVEWFKRCGVSYEKLRVLREGVPRNFFASTRPQRCRIPGSRDFSFLNVSMYDLPPVDVPPNWNQARKALHLLLKAFWEEFSADENVSLIIKGPTQRSSVETWLNLFGQNPAKLDQIVLVHGRISSDELVALFDSADAIVSVSRGEGWGRPLAEAMARGKPTIGTAFGGNLEFMDESNSYLVEYELVPVGDTFPQFAFHGMWAEPSVPALRRALRTVFTNRADASRRARRAADTVKACCAQEAIARDIVNHAAGLLT